MATFYGYKEREDPKKSMIDWASITKDITEGLYAEGRRREELKTTLQQDYVKQLNSLSEYTNGLNPTLNTEMLKAVQNYKAFLMQNHKLMKQGVISVDDSKIAKQGASDSFKNLNSFFTSVNGEIEKLVAAGGSRNEFMAQFAANTVDFKNQQLLIDEKTGVGSFAKLNADGTINKDTIVPFAATGQMFQPVKQIDINAELNNVTKDLAKRVEAESAYYSLSDIRQDKDNYDKWKDTTLNAMLTGDKLYAVAEALGYDVGDFAEGKTMKGYSEEGFVKFKLTDDQTKEIRKELSSMIEVRVDYEEKKTAPVKPSATETTEANQVGLIDKYVMNGDVKSLQAVLADSGFSSSTAPKADGRIFLTKGSETYTLDTKDKSAREVAEQLSGFLGIASAYNRSGKASGAFSPLATSPEGIKNYGTFVRTSKVSPATVTKLQNSMTATIDEFTMSPIPVNPQTVLNAAQDAAKELGLPVNTVKLDSVSGSLMIGSDPIGLPGDLTANDITQKLEALAGEDGAPTN